jgi:heptosyltransferase-2
VPERFDRILVIDLLGGLGDLLLVLPAIHALATRNPGARLCVLTHAPAEELLRADAAVHRVEVSGRGDEAATVAAVLRRFGPDLVVSTTRHSDIPALLTDYPGRVVDDLWRNPPADARVGERYLAILRAEGLIATDGPIDGTVTLTGAEIDAGRRTVGAAGPVAVLLPEAGMAVKQWPTARWATLAGELDALGVTALTCTRKPIEIPPARPLPRTSLRGIAGYFAAVARSGVVIGADTGPLRLASAMGAPVVGLFGPTTAQRYGLGGGVNLQGLPYCPHRTPLAISEAPCWWDARCPLRAEGPACLADISVGAVRAVALDLLPLA